MKIGDRQQNNKCRLCGNRDEIVNDISEYSKLPQNEYKTRHNLSGKGDPLGIVQEIKIWLYYQMISVQTKISPRKWDAQNSMGFWDTNRSPNLS